MLARALVLGAALAAAAGCAPIGVGPATVSDVPRGTEERAFGTGALQGQLRENGTELDVRVERVCNVERFDLVERTTVRKYENTAPSNSVWTGIGGALFAGLGGTLAAAPSSFGDGSDSSSKQVRAAGAGVLAVGAVLLVIPAIDWLRARGEADRRVERVAEPGPMVRHGEGCGVAPAGTQVTLDLEGGRALLLGVVDGAGTVHVELREAIPSAWPLKRSDHAFVRADESGLGELELASVYASRDAAAWHALAESACAESPSSTGCEGEHAYVRDYPDGAYTKDAESRIAAAGDRQRAAEEEAAWAALEPGACKARRRRDAELACAAVQAFVSAYPSSKHAPEANAVLARSGGTTRR